jgi:hypothetical protein
LDNEPGQARKIKSKIDGKYPILVTRELKTAKDWVREKARGTERFGLICSSGAHRLRPFGITVKAKVDPPNWFLNDSSDIRSSFYLEEVATEFDIQGLELDWAIVAWDGDLRYEDGKWEYYSFRGTDWNSVRDEARTIYLKNAYRVLLTRSRQGMIIFVPEGEEEDRTRSPQFYDETFKYLSELGIKQVSEV